MRKILEVFKLSLLNSSLKQIGINVLEASVDLLIENDAVKSIPIIGTIVNACDAFLSLRERNLIKQLSVFLSNLEDGTVSDADKEKYIKKLNNDKEIEKILDMMLLLLERNVEAIKSVYYAKIFKSYIAQIIDNKDFLEMINIVDGIFASDTNVLYEIYVNKEKNNIYSTSSINRLYAIGLVDKTELVEEATLQFNVIELTAIGLKFCQIIFDNECK